VIEGRIGVVQDHDVDFVRARREGLGQPGDRAPGVALPASAFRRHGRRRGFARARKMVM